MAPNFANKRRVLDLKLILFGKNRFRPEIERGVSYMRDVTVVETIPK